MSSTTPSAEARALSDARDAIQALLDDRARDAAWLTLRALEQDDRSALAWALVGRILVEVSQEPLGTIASAHAIELGLPEPERRDFERHHRIDLWSRGLLREASGAAILRARDLEDASRFSETPTTRAWIEEQLAPFGGMRGALRAARRMIAAFSEAAIVPDVGDVNPLALPGEWAETEDYTEWKAEHEAERAEQERANDGAASAPTNGARGAATDAAAHAHAGNGHAAHDHGELMVLSDHWIQAEIAGLASTGAIDGAIERATLWAQLRPNKLAPKAALLHLQHMAGRTAERDATAKQLIDAHVRDLNELEDARVALGETGMWAEQLQILAQMEQLAPDHPVILANQGVALISIGENDAGVKALERALAIDPTNGPALANLGLERMRRGEYVDARSLLERAVDAAPDQLEPLIFRAVCKNNQGERRAAVADLEKVLKLDPANATAKKLLDDVRGAKG
ncbi:hypothetical protein L6R52_05200 [Myxococcota bacterium]|nr:hypothetical protein [Myxococcota bacterium]